MSLFEKITAFFRNGLNRKKRDQEWAERFTNPPANRDGKLPLDPGKSELS